LPLQFRSPFQRGPPLAIGDGVAAAIDEEDRGAVDTIGLASSLISVT
jgi:hypothetical protein